MVNYEKIRISVMGMIKNSENSFLMIYKKNGPDPNKWDFPGGGLQPGEQINEALTREIFEETGLNESSFNIGKVLLLSEEFFPEWKGKGLHSISIIYSCHVIDKYELHIQDSDEVEEIKWINPKKISIEKLSKRSCLAFSEIGLI